MKISLIFSMLLAISAADTDDLTKTFRNGNNQFTGNMFAEVVKNKPDESLVISAFSVLTPLAQLALASEGETHDQLLSAIGMPNDNVTIQTFSKFQNSLKSVQGIELKTASKVYVAKGYELNEEFKHISEDTFNSEVKNVDFTDAQDTANEINAWVEDKTNHKIKDLVDPNSLDANTRAMLVNAIYFKGLWQNPFPKFMTNEREFHVTKDKTIKTPMMYQQSEFKYAEDDELKAKILEMKYEGDEASMILVLPKEIDGINELQQKLKDPNVLFNAINKLESTQVEVIIPKFKIETTTDLKRVLENMNVDKIFSPGTARLRRLLKGQEENLYISEALQKAFIEVNEEGAEAAAANVLVVHKKKGVNLKRAKRFLADRPFYFEIRVDGITLFNGVKRQ